MVTGRVSASVAVSSKQFQLDGGQLHHDRLSVLNKSARCLAQIVASAVKRFLSFGCCLVGNLVAPLLDGLNDLLNDGSLSDGPHGRSNVGGGLRKPESVSNGGNGGSSISRGSIGVSSIAGVGGGSVASVGGGVSTGKASVGVAVAEPVGVSHLRIGLSGGGGDSDGENDESEHDDLCWLGSEELTVAVAAAAAEADPQVAYANGLGYGHAYAGFAGAYP